MRWLLYSVISVLMVSCGSGETNNDENNNDDAVLTQNADAVVMKLLKKNTCQTCHKVNEKLVGPSFTDIAQRNYTAEQITALIYEPKPSNWPDYPPMMPMRNVAKEEVQQIAEWIVSLKK